MHYRFKPVHLPAWRESTPLYRLLRKNGKFNSSDEAKAAFEDLKHLLQSNPILASPAEAEPMLLYISATTQVISIIMAVEREEQRKAQRVQYPVYYVGEVLSSSKTRYPHYQKITYDVFMAARKLRHYFQANPITVVSHAPLSDIINNRDASGRVAKWVTELLPFEISYKPRSVIKSKALADFIVEWTEAQKIPQNIDLEY